MSSFNFRTGTSPGLGDSYAKLQSSMSTPVYMHAIETYLRAVARRNEVVRPRFLQELLRCDHETAFVLASLSMLYGGSAPR